MKPYIDYDTIPAFFARCFNGQCSRCEECLHYQAAIITPPEITTLIIINPTRISSFGDNCPDFKSCVKQRYAQGMAHLFDPLPYAVAQKVKQQMLQQWGQTGFYRLHRKETFFTPEQQEYVRQLFLQYGITTLPQFDKFVDKYAW